MKRFAAAVAVVVMSALVSCSNTQPLSSPSKPEPRPQASSTPTMVEPNVGHRHRFDAIVTDMSDAVRRVDLTTMSPSTTIDDIEYNYFGLGHTYRIDILDVVSTTSREWCVVDTKNEVRFAHRAEVKQERSVFIVGDGTACSTEPARAHTIAQITEENGLTFDKSSKVTRKLFRFALAPRQP